MNAAQAGAHLEEPERFNPFPLAGQGLQSNGQVKLTAFGPDKGQVHPETTKELKLLP